jgi:NADPH:quinone reductase-like Zn-dependent oxidoreductase
MAGTVEALGHGVTAFRRGDEVYGMTGGVGGHQGSLAEFASVDATPLAHKPANLSMREAAALALIVITAWEGLVDRARIAAGQTVLLHGGGGGVGHAAIQIARHFGAKVFATGSEPKRGLIEWLGATFTDYRNEPVADYVARLTAGRGFDLVYDTVGGTTLDASFEAVRRFGHVVSCFGWGSHALGPLSFSGGDLLWRVHAAAAAEGRAHHGEILRAAASLAEAGKLVPTLDPRRFGLATVCEAYPANKDRTARGKIVVDVLESHAAEKRCG